MNIPFIQAANYTPANRNRIDWIILHTMEAPETPGRALQVADWFAGASAPQASAHYEVDQGQVVQSVLEKDIAWQVQSKNDIGNAFGIGIEHAGYAAWTPSEWSSANAEAMLKLSASLTAAIAQRWNIPIIWVDAAGLQRGQRGITSHQQISNGLNGGVGHQDPGVNFPAGHYLDLVQQASTGNVSSAVSIWATIFGGLALGGAAYLAYEAYVLRPIPTRHRRVV